MPRGNAFHVFGDSFTFPFTLVDMGALKVHRFSGATASGVSKPENRNRRRIDDVLSKGGAPCALFVFGTVDLHLSYYHNLWEKGKRTDFAAIARRYLAFVRGLNALHKCVVGPFPSTVPDDKVVGQVMAYGSASEAAIARAGARAVARATRFSERLRRHQRFRDCLRKECDDAGVAFVDPFPMLTGADGRLLPRFADPSEYSIHVLFEPLLPDLVRAVTGAMSSRCALPERYTVDLAESLRRYLRRKRAALRDKGLGFRFHG